MHKITFLGLVLAGCLTVASEASAQFPCGFYGAGPGYWYGVPTMWQYSYNGRTPPYFAVHPPVYYSGEIVRIPYGGAPWANAPSAVAGSPASIPSTIPSTIPSARL